MRRTARLLGVALAIAILLAASGAALGLSATPALVPEGETINDYLRLLEPSRRSNINGIAISPDGRTLASGSGDQTVRLWEVSSGALKQTLQGHSSWVRSVAFSPDGRTLASGSDDQTVRLWDASSGALKQTLQGHSARVWSVAFSPDGRTLASGSSDQTVRLWEVSSGALKQTLQGHSSWVRSVAFSPDGRTLASGSGDQTVRLWEVSSGALKQTLQGHLALSVAFSPDGRTLASGSSDQTVRLWDASSGALKQTLQGHSDWVRSVAFSPDGRTLASGSSDQTVRLWEVSSGALKQTLQGHSGLVLSVAFSPDGRTLASGSDDQTVRLWDASSGALKQTLQGHSGLVLSVAFSPDGRTLASGSSDQTVRLWDASSGALKQTLQGHSARVWSVAFSSDGRTLASGSDDQTVRLWDASSGALKQTLQGHSDWVRSVAFSPDGRTLASGSGDQTVRLWDASSGALKQTLQGHSDWVRSVAFSPDGRTLASGSSDQTVRLWEVSSGALKQTLQGHLALSVAFSPDGRTLASGSDDQTVRLWEVSSGALKQTLQGHRGTVWSVAYSPDGRTLASGSDDQTVRLWEVSSGALKQTLQGHGAGVRSVAYSPDGRTLASGSDDQTVRLWEVTAMTDDQTPSAALTLVAGQRGNWIACWRDKLCKRHDDGTFLLRRDDATGLLEPMRPPDFAPDAKLEVASLRLDATTFTPDAFDPKSATTGMRLKEAVDLGASEVVGASLTFNNAGDGRIYWVDIVAADGSRSNPEGGVTLFPPERRVTFVEAHDTASIDFRLSGWAPDDQPHETDAEITLVVTSAHGPLARLTVPARILTPQLARPERAVEIQGDERPVLQLSLRNIGKRPLQQVVIQPSLEGVEAAFDPTSALDIPASSARTISFTIPDGVEVDRQSHLRLAIKTEPGKAYPVRAWTFASIPVQPAGLAWWIYAAAIALLPATGGLYYYQRVYRHPMVVRLTTNAAELLDVNLGALGEARAALDRARRLIPVLDAAGVGRESMDRAVGFAHGMSAQERANLLAARLRADCQPEAVADARLDAFTLKLPGDFMLNVPELLLLLPSSDLQPAALHEAVSTIPGVGNRLALVIAPQEPLMQACRTEAATHRRRWAVPASRDLTRLLLSPNAAEALAHILAAQINLSQISPYHTANAVPRDSLFFGRQELLTHILGREPANYILVGGRQVGKSSVLRTIERHYANDPAVDCRYRSIERRDLRGVLSRSLDLPAETSWDEVYEQLRRPEPGRYRLLLLDEMDVFVQQDAAHGYSVLREFRNLASEQSCYFILAGFWHLYESGLLGFHSPLRNFGETLQIGALEPDACRQLITQPMQHLNLRYAAPELVQQIIDDTGRRANLIAIVCNEIVRNIDAGSRVIEAAQVRQALDSREVSTALEGWRELSGDDARANRLDRVVVYAMAEAGPFTQTDLMRRLEALSYPYVLEDLRRCLLRLELAFILYRQDSSYGFQVPLFQALRRMEEPEEQLRRETREATA